LNCVICGSPITKRNSRNYCSDKCATRSETIRRSERKRLSRVEVIKQCLYCGSDFTPHIRNAGQVYCTQICLRRAMTKRQVENGMHAITLKKSREKHKERYIQKNDEYHDRIRFSGNKYPVLERDGHKCTKCGKVKGLIIHHIDGSGHDENPNNSMDNLTTLCRSCHMRHHASGDNNYLYKELTVDMFNSAKYGSKSLSEMANKLNMHRETLRRKAKELGLAEEIKEMAKSNPNLLRMGRFSRDEKGRIVSLGQ